MTDTIYLASSINGWNTADSSYAFTRTSRTTAEITFAVTEKVDGAMNHTVDVYGCGYVQTEIIDWSDLYK